MSILHVATEGWLLVS